MIQKRKSRQDRNPAAFDVSYEKGRRCFSRISVRFVEPLELAMATNAHAFVLSQLLKRFASIVILRSSELSACQPIFRIGG